MAAVRIDGSALRTAADFAARVQAVGRPCLLAGVAWPAVGRTGWLRDWPAAEAYLAARGVRVAARAPARVARSGGAFAPSAPPTPLAEYAAAARASQAPLAFSTAPRDELSRALRHVLDAPPPALRGVAAQPIVSLGGGGAGLAFHRHDGSWLWLVCGRKRWAFAPPETAPALVEGVRLPCADGGEPPRLSLGGAEVLECEQLPSELVYVPAGWWHATRNAPPPGCAQPAPLTLGLGGLGRSPGLHFDAARGHAHALAAAGGARALARQAEGLPCSLAHTAARHAQPAVLRALAGLERGRGSAGALAPLLGAPDGGALGATPLHWAAGAAGWRARAAVRLLLAAAPAALHAADRTGARPLHWVARSGDAAVARELLAAGADASASDAAGVRAVHLAAAEGHARLVRCLVREAGADARAPDGAGRTPLDWAEACGAADGVMRAALSDGGGR